MIPAKMARIAIESHSALLPKFKLNNCKIRMPIPVIPVITANFWPVFKAFGGSPASDILLFKLPMVGVFLF